MTAYRHSVVIHGHFYQPPRDDPWLETVEAQASALPFHDWNARVAEECYRAVVAARVPGSDNRISEIVNTLEFISFNFGPTLLAWLEKEAPRTYGAILDADLRSAKATGGFGNAMAQAYHHAILPLASPREKVSEIRWGTADFRKHFARNPVGMWLPETAVDAITLDVMAQEGIAFTIVAPHQVKEIPPNGLPGLYRTPGGRSIALFVYNGPLSHGVAFGSLLQDAKKWAQDMVGTTQDSGSIQGHNSTQHPDSTQKPDSPQDSDSPQNATPDKAGTPRLTSIATDGETYGHHHRFGEMALAAALRLLQEDPGVRVENFASFLSRNPPQHEVELVDPSSWSCAHGVERWRSDCGCKIHPEADTQQEWRTGLRDALEWLASEIHQIYEKEGPSLLGDQWAIRDRYGPWPDWGFKDTRARELLEMERQSLRFFTSCGWFFDDLAGVEPIQVLRYAARALELTGDRQEELEEEFLLRLEKAVSNEDPPRTGRTVFLEEAKPRISAHLRVAAGAALWYALSGTGTGTPGSRAQTGGNQEEDSGPSVPGYRTEPEADGVILVTHRQTGRQWDVETRMSRPSWGRGAIEVRALCESDEFVPIDLQDLPEGFHDPIAGVLNQRVPDLAGALLTAVEALGETEAGKPDLPAESIHRVQDLADLHILLGKPIPFDAQTTFFRILKDAPPIVVEQLASLRKPLGFTSA